MNARATILATMDMAASPAEFERAVIGFTGSMLY